MYLHNRYCSINDISTSYKISTFCSLQNLLEYEYCCLNSVTSVHLCDRSNKITANYDQVYHACISIKVADRLRSPRCCCCCCHDCQCCCWCYFVALSRCCSCFRFVACPLFCLLFFAVISLFALGFQYEYCVSGILYPVYCTWNTDTAVLHLLYFSPPRGNLPLQSYSRVIWSLCCDHRLYCHD